MGRSSLDEAALVVEALGREFEVTGVERLDVGGLDVTVLDLGEISGRRVAVSVLPEATTINIWSSRRAVAAGLLVAGGREPLVIVYSRRGRMTKAAYLYLGYSAYHKGFEVVVVNGGPGEVREVLESLSTIGRVRVSEERLYPVRP